MEENLAGKTCFVIMPFGEKKDIDGQPINFDVIYKDFIKDAVEGLDLKCIRCDEIAEAGWIHSKMFEYIFSADVAVVDITSLNPNVFYELGIRHALKKSVTILIRKAGTPTPFNIQGFQMLEYKPDDLQNLESGKQKIRDFIKNGIAGQVLDSPIYEVLDNLKVERKPKRIGAKNIYLYPITKVAGKEIGMITGDIQNIKEIDVWVNSENTNMQMARHFERSISATIRYLGAKRDRAGRVVDDLVANELREVAGSADVPAGIVIPTGSGELNKSHNVKKIFHAASVIGQVGRGYMPITEIAECVRNALKLIDSDEMAAENIQSILFPLMGTGTTRLDADEISRQLIEAAISYVEENPQTKTQKIYFLAYHEEDLNICKHILEHNASITLSKS